MAVPSIIEPVAPSLLPMSRAPIVIQDQATIPGWVADLPSFRRWAQSADFPERGRFSFLNSELWVDLAMEEFFTRNQVKSAYAFAIQNLLHVKPTGRFVPDRMLLTHPQVNLSTEPDALFFFWQTMQAGRIRLVEKIDDGFLELEGTPDMTLEIVSKNSVRKDTVILRDLYWKAGVAEYWLVDARGDTPMFDILRHRPDGYTTTPANDGWLPSLVFGQEFRLSREQDPLGKPLFVVQAR